MQSVIHSISPSRARTRPRQKRGAPIAPLQDSIESAQQISEPIHYDVQGRATARYFNTTLTSVFRPVRAAKDQRIVCNEAHSRSYFSAMPA